eukprot:1194439-Prorocentrum_minimum.AAC.5
MVEIPWCERNTHSKPIEAPPGGQFRTACPPHGPLLGDRVPPFPDAIAREMIEEQIKGPIEDTFSEFNPVAVAAASLGQVSLKTYPDSVP